MLSMSALGLVAVELLDLSYVLATPDMPADWREVDGWYAVLAFESLYAGWP